MTIRKQRRIMVAATAALGFAINPVFHMAGTQSVLAGSWSLGVYWAAVILWYRA